MTNQHRSPDPLSLIAAEVRRRGLPEHGGLNAEIWHRSQSHARYAADGTQRPTSLPADEAIATLPEQVWQEVAADFGRRATDLAAAQAAQIGHRGTGRRSAAAPAAAQEPPARRSTPSSTRAVGPGR